ncbi:hypothetical protein BOTBODRAFT_110017 [Botryobasidium botryosum FD-172 SS1]|uniref:MARVEL domain-containing protein n=1 Tax=Botryobasidium botryosum (strain FD-172 SS1) TaxID=930990 RepID=A0A067MIM3_BOTB1|nr:hypothetical protein BOTBODRAFT_110017 [Botryobasidium botryosum FD-172 SS1]
MIRRGHPILFGLICFFGIVEGCLATWLAVHFGRHHNWYSIAVRDRTYFITFVSWWTVLFSAFFTILFLHSPTGSVFTSIGAHLVFLALTWIFWTAAAASITAANGGGFNCTSPQIVYCNQLNALEGFAWAEWILTTIAFFVVLFLGIRSVRRGSGYRGHLVDA